MSVWKTISRRAKLAFTSLDEDQCSQLLDEAQSITDEINTTCDPELFFSKYEILLEKLERLAYGFTLAKFEGTPLKKLFRSVSSPMQKDASVRFLIDRCFERAEKNISECVRIDQFPLFVEEFESKFDPVLGKLTVPQLAYISACSHDLRELCRISIEDQTEIAPAVSAEKKVRENPKADALEETSAEEERRKKYQQLLLELEQAAKERKEEQEQRQQKELEQRREREEKYKNMSEAELLDETVRLIPNRLFISENDLKEFFVSVDLEVVRRILDHLVDTGLLDPTAERGRYFCSMRTEKDVQSKTAQNEAEPLDGWFFDRMSGHEFENFCARLLEGNGFIDVQVTQASGDFGVDLLAEKDGITYAIQCKCYTGKVGNHAVQEAYSGAQYYGRMVAAVLTNSYFTLAAEETAKRTRVLLWDRDKLLEMYRPTQHQPS